MTGYASYHGKPEPASWMADAACRHDGIPTWMFFPARDDIRTYRAAVAICARCPVIDACADYARTTRPVGIWAGRSWDSHRDDPERACEEGKAS